MEFTTTLSVNNASTLTVNNTTPINNATPVKDVTLNVNYQTDLRLLSNRKAIELNSISIDNAYERRLAMINIEKKYAVIIEALVGLYELGIEHNCSLASIISIYTSI
jgi:hypothetical protein